MKRLTVIIISIAFLFISCKKSESGDIDGGWDRPTSDDVLIKVMTYNVHSCIPVGSSTPNPQGIADVIKEANPDVVMLQEIEVNTTNSGGIDQLAKLSELTGMNYYYFGKAINYNNGAFGVGLLSKYKLDATNTTMLPLIPKKNSTDYVEQRVLAEGRITFKGYQLTVATTHLDLTQYNRDVQIPAIDAQLSKNSYPIIFGGDFNARPTDSGIATLQSLSYTFTSLSGQSISNYLIDYITYRPAMRFKPMLHQIVTSAAGHSDHNPVVDVFKLQ